MKTTNKPSARLDDIDRDQFARMVDSEPFKRLIERVTQMLERSRGACERSSDATELHRSQGEVTAYRAVLHLPQVLIEELKGR